MSTRVIRQIRDPFDSLERMLNRTTLTTQRVQHEQIIELGGRMLTVKADDTTAERDKAIQDAVDAAEARATRELRAALKRFKHHKDDERNRALRTQKEYFDRHAQRVSDMRDKAEEERLREHTKELQKLHQKELQAQYKESLRVKDAAVVQACKELREQLRIEFMEERDRAIAEAVRKTKEACKAEEADMIEKTILECQEKARLEAERVASLHQAELDKQQNRYNILTKKYKNEVAQKEQLLADFKHLQEDYKRFMDNTGGRYHSDYLMRLRYLGLQLSNKTNNTANYYDLCDEEM